MRKALAALAIVITVGAVGGAGLPRSYTAPMGTMTRTWDTGKFSYMYLATTSNQISIRFAYRTINDTLTFEVPRIYDEGILAPLVMTPLASDSTGFLGPIGPFTPPPIGIRVFRDDGATAVNVTVW